MGRIMGRHCTSFVGIYPDVYISSLRLYGDLTAVGMGIQVIFITWFIIGILISGNQCAGMEFGSLLGGVCPDTLVVLC